MKNQARKVRFFGTFPLGIVPLLLASCLMLCFSSASVGALPWSDDMESGTNGWTATGLWHMVEDGVSPCPDSNSPTNSWWYGTDSNCTYNNGLTNAGCLTSTLIDFSTAANAVLKFWYLYETETSTASPWDSRKVDIDPGTGWAPLEQLYDDTMNVWNQKSINLTPYVGNVVQIRFCFDTGDDAWNDFKGWYIDDVLIEEDIIPPQILSTVPADGAIDIALNEPIVVTFSEAMDTGTVVLSSAPDPGGWSVTWTGGNTIANYTHNAFTSLTGYTLQITAGSDLMGNPLAGGGAPNPWTFTTKLDLPPTIVQTSPADGTTGVALSEYIVVTFSEPMDTGSVALSSVPDPGGWSVAWASANSIASYTHNDFSYSSSYTIQITGTDAMGQSLTAGAVANPWAFETVLDLTPPAVPTLQSPSNGSYGVATQTFSWTEVTDPSGVTYDLQISTDPGFGIVDIDKTGIVSNSYTLSGVPPELLTNGITYFWRVQAVDGSSNPSGFSSSFTMTADTILPQTTYDGFDGTLGSNGWYTTSGTFTLSASDVPSGVSKTYYGYGGADTISERPYTWIDATDGTNTGLSGDDQTIAVPVGFSFPFYGVDYTNVYVCTNGWISFTYSGISYSNIEFPSASMDNTIAALWDDLTTSDPAANIYYKNLSSPNRLVVEWNNVPRLGGGTPSTFEVILYETGEIIWSFNTIGTSLTITVGMNKGDGVDGYTWKYGSPPSDGTSATNKSIYEYTGPVTMDTDGQYNIAYYSVDNAGNEEQENSAELKIDTTPPAGAAPAYLNEYTFDTSVEINWSSDPGYDYTSSISTYEVERATDEVNFSAVYSSTATDTYSWTDTDVVNGGKYSYRVKTFNFAGLSDTSPTTSTTIELTPPTSINEIRDGDGDDVDYISHYSYIDANWDASSDPETDIQEYLYRVGTSTGTGDLIPWTSAATNTSVTRDDVTLEPDNTYYFDVKAVNGAGLESETAYSDGQKVDITSPDPIPYVNDGTGSDVNFISSTSELSANWGASSDGESGIKQYNVYVGTAPWATDVVSSTSTLSTSITFSLTLEEGQTYYVTVEPVNGAGTVGSPTCSNGQTVDTTIIPAPSFIYDGLSDDVDYTNSSSLSANWEQAEESDRYWVAVGSAPGGATDTLDWTNAGNNTSYTADLSGSLVDGNTYYFSVKGEKISGKFSEAITSDGIVYDVSPPVFSGANSATDTGAGGQVSLSWEAAQDASPPVVYNVYQATDPGGFNYSAPTVSGVTSSPSLVSGLTDGTTYYFVVRAQDDLGQEDSNTTAVSAVPTTADSDPPAAPTAFGAVAGDQQVWLSWINPTDSDFAGVKLVQKTGGYPSSVSDGTMLYQGTGTSHKDTSLTNKTTYYYTLFACDSVPNCSSAQASAVPDAAALRLSAGWNMIALSTNPSSGATSTIFSGYDVVVCMYAEGVLTCDSDPSFPEMSPGIGYWAHTDTDIASIDVSGSDVTDSPYEISLKAGWNAFGSPYKEAVPWDDTHISFKEGAGSPVALSAATDKVNTTIYYFNTPLEQYQAMAPGSGLSAAPWSGYWIRALKDCTMIINSP